jgi:hypothetical protein
MLFELTARDDIYSSEEDIRTRRTKLVLEGSMFVKAGSVNVT